MLYGIEPENILCIQSTLGRYIPIVHQIVLHKIYTSIATN